MSDDGSGFEAGPRASGVGLAGMKERVSALSGRLAIDSAPGGGTTLRAWLPIAGR